MKTIGIIILVILSLTSSVSAQNQDKVFKLLKTNYIALNVLDVASTYYNLHKSPDVKEVGVIGRHVIHKPLIAIPLKAGVTYATLKTFDFIYQESKPIGYVIAVGMNIITGMVVKQNIDVAITITF